MAGSLPYCSLHSLPSCPCRLRRRLSCSHCEPFLPELHPRQGTGLAGLGSVHPAALERQRVLRHRAVTVTVGSGRVEAGRGMLYLFWKGLNWAGWTLPRG